MKRIERTIEKLLVDREFCRLLQRNHDSVGHENLLMLQRLSTLGFALMGAITLMAFLFPYLYRMQVLYPKYLAAYTLCFALAFTLAKKRYRFRVLAACLLVLVTAAFGMELGIFYTREGNANLFMVFLIIVPMFFITRPAHTLLFAFAVCMAFSILTYKVKAVKYYEIDITNCWVSYVISMVGTRMINGVRIENIDARRRLFDETRIDGLTKLNNRRALNAHMETLHPKLLAGRARVVFYMIDIDIFKMFNDTYGHLDGDECLTELGRIFQALSDTYGLYVARYGGEEFAAVSADDALDAQAVGQAIVDAVYQANMAFGVSPYGRVTVSVGCADSASGGGENDFDLISHADIALYCAKEHGRNKFTMYTPTN